MDRGKTLSLDVTLLDLGSGNLHTVRRKLERLGARVVVTAEPEVVAGADKLVVPGVGHFGAAMAHLRSSGLAEALGRAALEREVPTLGLCLGMQILAEHGEEGGGPGLGWLPGRVVRLRPPDPLRYKVPHMGWNRLSVLRSEALLEGIPSEAEFYFAHSYHWAGADPADVAAETEYGYRFPSVIRRGALMGVQFHPERSHEAGLRLLRNFLSL